MDQWYYLPEVFDSNTEATAANILVEQLLFDVIVSVTSFEGVALPFGHRCDMSLSI